MVRRVALGSALVVALAVVAAGCGGGGGGGGSTPSTTTSASGCGTVTIGFMGPITGPAASIGDDQLHWAEYFVSQWNKSHTPKLKLTQGDT